MEKDLPINIYHKREGISSTILKTILKSPAHLEKALRDGFSSTKATVLGDAVHAFILQPERFSQMYSTSIEVYQRKTGDKVAGDPKTDDMGNPLVFLESKIDESMHIKGEEYKKFSAMIEAYSLSKDAKELVESAEYIECSFFFKNLKVRPDFITKDGWIVDIKTVGGDKDKPSSPENFCYGFFDNGYDVQMYMYFNVVKQEISNIKGFKFLCLDAKIPSGIQIYTFIPEESKWFELGGYRFKKAMELYKEFKKEKVHKVYNNELPEELPLSYKAETLLAEFRDKE